MQAPYDFSPRLPVYFVVDCSGTMLGTKIESVKQGINRVRAVLSSDPRSASSVAICVIWFNDDAYRTELTPITRFVLPDLKVIGKTALGKALAKLNEALDRDLVPPRMASDGTTLPGDYRPLVFLLTDGLPTEDERTAETARWQVQAERLKTRASMRPLHTIGLAIGADADTDLLGQITDDVLLINDQLEAGLQTYFDWVPDVVLQAGAAEAAGSGYATAMPAVPTTITHIGKLPRA